jgi:hypothetical protein
MRGNCRYSLPKASWEEKEESDCQLLEPTGMGECMFGVGPHWRSRAECSVTGVIGRLVVTPLLVVVVACTTSASTSRAGSPAAVSTSGINSSPAGQAIAGTAIAHLGGCGLTPVRQGGMPLWVLEAGAPSYLPYVVAASQRVVAVIFSYPLRAGHPTDPANKILWVARQPGTASLLQIDGHPVEATTPSFHQT